MNEFTPLIFLFDEFHSGVIDVLNELDDRAELKLSDELLDLVVLETNKHFNFISECPPREKSRLQQWLPLRKKELKLCLAVIMHMTHNKKARLENY